MVNLQSGNRLQLVCHKVQFQAPFFLIYINDPLLGLTTSIKLFADGTSLFPVVINASVSASRVNNDLVKIRDWDFNQKMWFNPDPTKQEVIFSKKKKKKILGTHPFSNKLETVRYNAALAITGAIKGTSTSHYFLCCHFFDAFLGYTYE